MERVEGMEERKIILFKKSHGEGSHLMRSSKWKDNFKAGPRETGRKVLK